VHLGGPDRLRVVLPLAGVLALSSADTGTLGAAAAQLEADLHISHARLGLLATVSACAGVLATIPMGVLADRVNRVRLLTGTVVVWALGMAAGGLAPDYRWLLLSRLLLGAAAGASGPVLISLIGDLVPPARRAAVLGWILSGEIAGTGLGLIGGGEIAAELSWRYAFFLLAAASGALAVVVWRLLREPPRGCAGEPGEPVAARSRIVHGVAPAPERIAGAAAVRLSWPRAWRYLLRIPANRSLIVASALGYFFFAGLRTFGVVFAIRHFHVSQQMLGAFVPIVGVAALAGTVFGGRLADRALGRGHTSARIVVPAVGYTAAALLFVPGISLSLVVVALPAITLGATALAAANPPLDAARLDIVPAALWGRAESLRTLLRLAAEAAAPAAFGLAADLIAGTGGGSDTAGLRDAFLIMVGTLFANGLLLLLALRSYPVDVATAEASDRAALESG
jgi:predicted MFS family arabinose efflux permease